MNLEIINKAKHNSIKLTLAKDRVSIKIPEGISYELRERIIDFAKIGIKISHYSTLRGKIEFDNNDKLFCDLCTKLRQGPRKKTKHYTIYENGNIYYT